MTLWTEWAPDMTDALHGAAFLLGAVVGWLGRALHG